MSELNGIPIRRFDPKRADPIIDKMKTLADGHSKVTNTVAHIENAARIEQFYHKRIEAHMELRRQAEASDMTSAQVTELMLEFYKLEVVCHPH